MYNIPVSPTYHQLHEITLKLGVQLESFVEAKNTRVVGIARGGLFMASILSHQLDIPISIVSYSSELGKGHSKHHDNILTYLRENKLILVDDICDTGNTMKEVHQWYTTRGHNVHTIAYYTKEGSVYQPRLSWYTTPADFPWVTFPWEDITIV